jgi:hypothetical protein
LSLNTIDQQLFSPVTPDVLAYFDNYFYDRNKAGLYYQKSTNRLFLNLFVLNPRVANSKGWNVVEDSPDYEQSLDTVIGAPITLWRHPATNDFDHPQLLRSDASNEDNLQYIQSQGVGIALTKYRQNNGDVRTLGEFIEPNVKAKLINWLETGKIPDANDLPLFTSPELAHFDPRESIKKFWITHIALVSNPAFPREVSIIRGSPCAGDAISCGQKLAAASQDIVPECKGTQVEDLLIRSYHIAKSAASNTIHLMSMNNDSSNTRQGINPTNTQAIANFQQSLDNARKVGSMTYTEAMAAVNKQFNDSQQETKATNLPQTVNIFTGQVGQPGGTPDNNEAAKQGQQQGQTGQTNTNANEPPKQPETKADSSPDNNNNKQAPDVNNNNNNNNKDTEKPDPEKDAMKATIKRFEDKEKKDEIAKKIPVACFLNPDGQFDEKKANSLIEFWFTSNKKLDDIEQYYKDNPPAPVAMKVPAAGAAGGPGKARASTTPDTETYKYDMNELGGDDRIDNKEELDDDPDAQLMIDNASAGVPDDLWFIGLQKLVILDDPNAPPRDKGKGSPRSVI